MLDHGHYTDPPPFLCFSDSRCFPPFPFPVRPPHGICILYHCKDVLSCPLRVDSSAPVSLFPRACPPFTSFSFTHDVFHHFRASPVPAIRFTSPLGLSGWQWHLSSLSPWYAGLPWPRSLIFPPTLHLPPLFVFPERILPRTIPLTTRPPPLGPPFFPSFLRIGIPVGFIPLRSHPPLSFRRFFLITVLRQNLFPNDPPSLLLSPHCASPPPARL